MRKTHGGVSFVIDRPKGYTKHWPDKSFTYPCDYGYFPGLKGEDGEGLDAFVGDDTDGHYESFQKLTSDTPPVLDETKFLVGVNTQDREKIYALYGNEIHARRVYRGMSELKAALEKFETKKKGRYMQSPVKDKLAADVRRVKAAAFKTVLARYKLSDLKQADIEKLIRGNIIGLKGGDNQGPAEAASDEDRLMRTFRDADSKASEGTEGGEALPSQGGLTL